MQQILLQNATATFLQNATEIYYWMRRFYYKMQQLLQNATFITKFVGTTNEKRYIIMVNYIKRLKKQNF